MAQNFLYMFEFVVDDLLVTRSNSCAPEEYPTCCEVSFRNSVFISICDREFGQCVDDCSPKCGKCCLFALESPITDSDKLQIHVYKKKTEKCKFLVGCTEMPVKNLFDKVMEKFNTENPNWQEMQSKHLQNIPNSSEPKKPTEIIDNDCDSDFEGRREQLCPTSELTKSLLPLFNLKRSQTGNVVLIIRLVANGPAIVSTFPLARICEAGCERKLTNCKSKKSASNNKPCTRAQEICSSIPDCCSGFKDSNRNGKASTMRCGATKQYKSFQNQNNGCMPMQDPCLKEVKNPVCRRYFACNADKGCPCDYVEDECERSPKYNKQKLALACCEAPKPSCGGNHNGFGQLRGCDYEECMNECEAVQNSLDSSPSTDPVSTYTCGDDCEKNPYVPCGPCMQPCFQTPRRPEPGPEAYDEYEACLNGSGLVIRVLKDTHQVENICDGSEDFIKDNDSDCNQYNGKKNQQNSQCSLRKILQRSNYARNHIKRRTGGHIINHPDLPKIRANIKYSGKDDSYPDKYHVPFTKIKSYCDNQNNKLAKYRSQRSKPKCDECIPACSIKQRKDERNCCVQVNREDIRNIMKGLDVETRKKGIEVCYKTCEDTDSDVFLVKLGSKHKCQRKKNNIEIELKTPKQPLVLAKQHVTTETQITETELDAALMDACKKKNGKGKNKNKNKGKKKKTNKI